MNITYRWSLKVKEGVKLQQSRIHPHLQKLNCICYSNKFYGLITTIE